MKITGNKAYEAVIALTMVAAGAGTLIVGKDYIEQREEQRLGDPSVHKMFNSWVIFDKGARNVDVASALSFYEEYSKQEVDLNNDSKLSKDEMTKIIGWYRDLRASFEKSSSSVGVENCKKIIQKLEEVMGEKDSTSLPLPGILNRFDEDGNGSIDLKEAVKFYERIPDNKVEADEGGNITVQGYKGLINSFNRAATNPILSKYEKREYRRVQEMLQRSLFEAHKMNYVLGVAKLRKN